MQESKPTKEEYKLDKVYIHRDNMKFDFLVEKAKEIDSPICEQVYPKLDRDNNWMVYLPDGKVAKVGSYPEFSGPRLRWMIYYPDGSVNVSENKFDAIEIEVKS
jgi:hypothetical protein